MLHFAYGSNMDRRLMRRRCPGARLIGGAVLRDYRFIITKDGYASVAAARGALVHGLLWRLTPRDLAALNAYENIDAGLYRAASLTGAGGRPRGAGARLCGPQRRSRPAAAGLYGTRCGGRARCRAAGRLCRNSRTHLGYAVAVRRRTEWRELWPTKSVRSNA